MVHKTPGTGVWNLALRSQKMWQSLADSIQNDGSDPSEALGWRETGAKLLSLYAYIGHSLEKLQNFIEF